MRELIELAARIAELERRLASLFRHGKVKEVDAKKQLVRVQIGDPKDQEPFVGPWVPYAQIAGALKVHTPPSVGQQMTMLNPTGDFRQAVAIPLTWSDQNKSPSEKDDEHVLTFGQVKITLKSNKLTIAVGDRKIIVDEEQVQTIGRTKLGLDQENENAPKVETEAGPAKQTFAKTA